MLSNLNFTGPIHSGCSSFIHNNQVVHIIMEALFILICITPCLSCYTLNIRNASIGEESVIGFVKTAFESLLGSVK